MMSRLVTRTVAASALLGALSVVAASSALAASPPRIGFLDVDSASFGSFVGIYGSGFGTSTGSVAIGGATAIETALWSDNLIIVRIPAGAQTGLVRVRTSQGVQVESNTELKIHTGTVYVVSGNTGLDSYEGTEANPWQSLHRAMQEVKPGDTVLVRQGIYDEQQSPVDELPAMYIDPSTGGTAGKPITWRGFGAEMPVIRGSRALAANYPILYIQGDQVRFARMEIDGRGNNSNAVSLFGSSVWLTGLNIHSFSRMGVHVGEGSMVMLAGNHIHDGGTTANEDHAILSSARLSHIHSNVIANIPNGFGIYLMYPSQGESCHVYGNYIHDTGAGGIGLTRVGGGNRISNNVVWRAGLTHGCRCALQVGYGASIGESSTTDHIYYNTFVGPALNGALVADRNGPVELHSNLFANFTVGLRVEDDVSKASLASSHNLWWADGVEPPQFKWGGPYIDFSAFQSASKLESDSMVADPLLVDAEAGDLHLQPGSPAIDHGGGPVTPVIDFEGTVRPQGPERDIGAYEAPATQTDAGTEDAGTDADEPDGGEGGAAGQGGEGGAAGDGGSAGSSAGGSGGTAGSSSDAGGGEAGDEQGGSEAVTDSSDSGGCGCVTARSHAGMGAATALLVAAGAFMARRRRTR